MDTDFGLLVGSFSGKGKREFNCDCIAEHRIASTRTVAVALVDGTGNSSEVARDAFLCAHAAARVGVNKGVIPGVLAATDILGADPAVDFPAPDGVLALAISRPGEAFTIGAIGDAAAFAYDPAAEVALRKLTEDHTLGQRMRLRGDPEDAAAKYDSMITTSIGRASVGTITVVTTDASEVLLASDGVHRVLSERQIGAILAQHPVDADAAAMALGEAAQDASGADDASVVLLRRRGHRP